MLIAAQIGKILSVLDALMTHTKQHFAIEETSRRMMHVHEYDSPSTGHSTFRNEGDNLSPSSMQSPSPTPASYPEFDSMKSVGALSKDNAKSHPLKLASSRKFSRVKTMRTQKLAQKIRRVYDPETQDNMEKIECLLTLYQSLAAISTEITVRSCLLQIRH